MCRSFLLFGKIIRQFSDCFKCTFISSLSGKNSNDLLHYQILIITVYLLMGFNFFNDVYNSTFATTESQLGRNQSNELIHFAYYFLGQRTKICLKYLIQFESIVHLYCVEWFESFPLLDGLLTVKCSCLIVLYFVSQIQFDFHFPELMKSGQNIFLMFHLVCELYARVCARTHTHTKERTKKQKELGKKQQQVEAYQRTQAITKKEIVKCLCSSSLRWTKAQYLQVYAHCIDTAKCC